MCFSKPAAKLRKKNDICKHMPFFSRFFSFLFFAPCSCSCSFPLCGSDIGRLVHLSLSSIPSGSCVPALSIIGNTAFYLIIFVAYLRQFFVSSCIYQNFFVPLHPQRFHRPPALKPVETFKVPIWHHENRNDIIWMR